MMNKREWMLQACLSAMQGGLRMEPMDLSVSHLSDAYDAIVAATPEPADEGWIEHRGEKPYPEGNVVVQLRNGHTFDGDADMFVWTHDIDSSADDIVRWRPARA